MTDDQSAFHRVVSIVTLQCAGSRDDSHAD